MQKSILATATDYLARGFSVIPISRRSKRPLVKWKRYQATPPTTEQVSQWFRHPVNLGLVTGYGGLTVLDFDTVPAYMRWHGWAANSSTATMIANLGYKVRTSRGVHVYVRLNPAPRTKPFRGEGFDVKGTGGYVLAPPSVHPSGAVYKSPNPRAPILSVGALSDVLPLGLLLPPPSILSGSNNVIPESDPWKAITEIGVVRAGVVDAIRATYRVEQFVKPEVETGRNFYLARCPFHDDKNPSLWLNTELQVCGCFAGCTDKPLDVINLYARLHSIHNREAIWVLARGL
ncbi:MAG: bifunctional DNA primase/polymerase [Minisyncoccales bacterium]